MSFVKLLVPQDAMKYENGKLLHGSAIVVEWAKGNPRQSLVSNKASASVLS